MKKKRTETFSFEKMVTSLADIFTMEKPVVKNIQSLGVNVLFVNRFLFFVAIFTAFVKQKDDKSTLFPGGVSVKFLNDLLGLAKGKRNSTPTKTAYNTRYLGIA